MTRDDFIARQNEQIYADPEIHRVRRKELAVEDNAWIKALLHRAACAHLATCAGDQPFLNTHTYVYHEAENCLYFHRDPIGRTSANLERNPRVCYQVVEMGRMYAGADALDFGVEYRSVIVFGLARRVPTKEAARALRMLMEKYAPHLRFGVDYTPFKPNCPQSAAVYRVDILSWSGKRNEVPPDHPGAYEYFPAPPSGG